MDWLVDGYGAQVLLSEFDWVRSRKFRFAPAPTV
jgi:hypothetical protein